MAPANTVFEVSLIQHAEIEPMTRLLREVIASCGYYSERARQGEIEKYTSEAISLMIEGDPQSVLVARDGHRVIGFCMTEVDGELVWIAWYGVHPDCRSCGVGRALLRETIARAPARGAHKIWCDSRLTNIESTKALERAGFRRICELRDHWYREDFWLWERHVDS